MIAEAKTCLCCNRSIHGRSDKKFCNDSCRNTYHNNLKSIDSKYVRETNQYLLRNRRILEKLFTSSRQLVKTSKQKLLAQQFDFRYFTHQYNNRNGQRYSFCYEFGYRILKEVVMVMRKKV
jgi:hypothetical protein